MSENWKKKNVEEVSGNGSIYGQKQNLMPWTRSGRNAIGIRCAISQKEISNQSDETENGQHAIFWAGLHWLGDGWVIGLIVEVVFNLWNSNFWTLLNELQHMKRANSRLWITWSLRLATTRWISSLHNKSSDCYLVCYDGEYVSYHVWGAAYRAKLHLDPDAWRKLIYSTIYCT